MTGKRIIAAGVIGSVLLLACCGGLVAWFVGSRSDPASAGNVVKGDKKTTSVLTAQPPVIKLEADRLLVDYHAELAADKKYLNKRLALYGTVTSTQKLSGGRGLVVLVMFLNEIGLYSKRIHCVFARGSDAASIGAGNWVLVIGTCRGLATNEAGLVVQMDDCYLPTKEEREQVERSFAAPAPQPKSVPTPKDSSEWNPDSLPSSERLERAFARLKPDKRIVDRLPKSEFFPTYAGKIVEVWGTIVAVSAGGGRSPHVDISSPEGKVRCFFNPGLADEIKNLKVGKAAIVRGTVRNTDLDADPYEMQDCGIAYKRE